MFQQPLFDLYRLAAARVHESADAAARDDPMARDHERDTVRAARAADRARGAFQFPRNVEVGQRLTALRPSSRSYWITSCVELQVS